jgi:hypothetical protein
VDATTTKEPIMPEPRQPFETLTDDQLAALEYEDIQFYIDIACAEQGIPLLPAEPVPPPERTITKSGVHYVIGTWRFSQREAAEAIADVVNKQHEFRRETKYIGDSWRYNSPTYDAREDTPEVSVTTERVFTMSEAAAQQEDINKWAAAKKQYEDDKKAYDSTSKGRNAAGVEIRSRVEDAARKVRRREFLKAEYQKYLTLANGVIDIAGRFLYRAYSDAKESGIENPGEPVREAPTGDRDDALDEVL